MTPSGWTKKYLLPSLVVLAASTTAVSAVRAQQRTAPDAAARPNTTQQVLPAGYVIGPADVLSVIFWRDKDMSADVVVRPDGKITLPLLNDVHAAGLTPEELGQALQKAASKYVSEPNASVIVREIHSRKVYVVGEVGQPGAIPLMDDMNVLQLIALAGGLSETADQKNITIVRQENGRERRYKFNYKDVIRGKHPEQNILLKPGDTVVVR